MREGRARRSFRLKIERMKAALKDGAVPSEIPLLSKVDDLVSWHEPPDLIAWKSFSVAAPNGPNADLREQFDRIFPAFVKLQTGRTIRGAMPPKARPISEWLLEDELQALMRQNVDLIARLEVTDQELETARGLVKALQKENAKLTAELSRIIPLRTAK